MASVFTKIISGELPSYKVYESDKVLAFLALDQINLGHTLVIPKKEVDHFFDMDIDSYEEVFAVTQVLSKIIKEKFPCKRVALAVQGFEVAHAHVHLIPLNSPEEFDFKKGKQRSKEDMLEAQKLIAESL